jgi:catechol 2,3-dioxygenase-like lactoylglutathione lyase family enzyme
MRYKLSVVRIFVTDWERALRFYTETLEIPLAFKNDAMGWAQLNTGEGQLALERVDPSDAEGRALVGRFVGVSLEVPDALATYERLVERGVDFVEPPEKQAWGGILAHLRDPDRNVITLVGNPK